ncbi:hypothetical protein CL620_04955 [archaeon]|jgi:hypothetical protein|nr:hypothetical protein [archaeon]|tara:strand:+ start:222 stop:524 length:303 start_codon:yes stop_codon:yes gene_type:complete
MPKRTEKEEIKRDGATGVKNSGRGMKKGDAQLNKFLIDYKHCGKSFTISLKNWRKHAKDSWNDQYRHPCYGLVLGENSECKLAVIDWNVFRELVGGSDYE